MAIQVLRSSKHKKIPIQEQILLLEKIGQLLNQGYSISDALKGLNWHPKWENTLNQIAYKLESGGIFDRILADLHFDQKIVSFIYFALQHGNLVDAINHSVKFINQQINLLNQFKQAIRYPLVLISSFLIVLFFVDLYVYPAFAQIYSTNQGSSEALTMAMTIVNFAFNSLYLSLLIILLMMISWFFMKDRLSIETKARFVTLLPFFSTFIKKYNSLMFAIYLSSLLEAGLSLKSALMLIVNHNKQLLLSYYCQSLLIELENGLSFEQALNKVGYFEKNLVQLFQNKVNRFILRRDLNTYATFSFEQLQLTTTKLINRIQPAVFFIIAVSIVLIYLSILLPMLQLIQTI